MKWTLTRKADYRERLFPTTVHQGLLFPHNCGPQITISLSFANFNKIEELIYVFFVLEGNVASCSQLFCLTIRKYLQLARLILKQQCQ